jgi:hypothetical protein
MADVQLYRALTSFVPGEPPLYLPAVPYARLTDQEYRVWDIHLPDYSCSCAECDDLDNELDDLRDEDELPEEVQAALRQARSGEYFDVIQLWTSENSWDECLLVGVKGEETYLIARWGIDLRDYFDIEHEVVGKALEAYDPDSEDEPATADKDDDLSFGSVVVGAILFLALAYCAFRFLLAMLNFLVVLVHG